MVETTKVKKVSRISPVWIVPFVAFAIAVWLAVQARLDKGQEIEIIFENASDIVPGQTQIRLKDVQVGKVIAVRLSSDLKEVIVKAEIDRNVSKYLSVNTRFWVVTPRISTSGVSNLGTLISGVFIVMDPGEQGESEDEFRGLDESPILASDEEGTRYVLQSETLGSLDIGSPIYYRQIKVGEVTGYKLADTQQHVDVSFFVRAPHDQMVTKRSRFWDVSGFGVSLGADGVKAKMASVTSLLAGGIEFDNSASFGANTLAEEGHRFYLYPDRDSVLEERYTVKHHYLLRFSGSVKGLTVGAPVEFRGIKVGEVVDVVLDSPENVDKSLLVYIAMQPQRFEEGAPTARDEVDQRLGRMIAQGLKAQMATSSLITGAKYIELLFMEESPGELVRFDSYSEIPTADDYASQLTQKLDSVLAQVAEVPIQQIGEDLGQSMSSLRAILETLDKQNTAGKIDGAMEGLDDTLAATSETIKQAEELLQNVNNLVAPDSEVKHGLTEMLDSLSDAGKSLQFFLDELNRHPNALIGGAEKDE